MIITTTTMVIPTTTMAIPLNVNVIVPGGVCVGVMNVTRHAETKTN
jgi:hypothetical protein